MDIDCINLPNWWLGNGDNRGGRDFGSTPDRDVHHGRVGSLRCGRAEGEYRHSQNRYKFHNEKWLIANDPPNRVQ